MTANAPQRRPQSQLKPQPLQRLISASTHSKLLDHCITASLHHCITASVRQEGAQFTPTVWAGGGVQRGGVHFSLACARRARAVPTPPPRHCHAGHAHGPAQGHGGTRRSTTCQCSAFALGSWPLHDFIAPSPLHPRMRGPCAFSGPHALDRSHWHDAEVCAPQVPQSRPA